MVPSAHCACRPVVLRCMQFTKCTLSLDADDVQYQICFSVPGLNLTIYMSATTTQASAAPTVLSVFWQAEVVGVLGSGAGKPS